MFKSLIVTDLNSGFKRSPSQSEHSASFVSEINPKPSQIGSGLVGVMYVLDEPTIGLHARDTSRLIKTLKQMRDRGNSVIMVEHDLDTIRQADHIID